MCNVFKNFICNNNNQIIIIILLYFINLKFVANQNLNLNLIIFTIIIFSLNYIIYNFNKKYYFTEITINRILFLIIFSIVIYNLYQQNYLIFLSLSFWLILHLIKKNYKIKTIKLVKLLNELKNDEDKLEHHFKNDLLIFDYMRTFRSVSFIFFFCFGFLSIYCNYKYNIVLITEKTLEFFLYFYFVINFLCLFVSLYSIFFLNPTTTHVFIQACKTCFKYTVIAGAPSLIMSKTIIPIFPPSQLGID